MKNKALYTLIVSALLTACTSEPTTPKPKGYFRIGVPEFSYEALAEESNTNMPYGFEINTAAQWETNPRQELWGDVYYPSLRSRIQLTYKPVDGNLDTLMMESQKLAFKHTVKASGMGEQQFINPEAKVYGMLYQINGNAASPLQFYITDSTHHFLRGAVYFFSTPNADSLQPAVDFMKEDVIHLIETAHWNE